MPAASPTAPAGPAGPPPHPDVRPLDALTAMRFIAAMLVVIYHYSAVHFGDAPKVGLPAVGYTGVTFFFMLSGFILAYNYRRVDFSRAGSRGRFYWARFARIYPVYLLSLALALPFFFAAWRQVTPALVHTLYGASALLSPLGLQAWVPGAACALNCPSWSISTEFFFYLVFPFVFPLVYARPARWSAITGGLWLLVLGVCVFVWGQAGDGTSLMSDRHAGASAELAAQFVKYFPPVRVPEFLAGIVLYVAWERAGTRMAVPVLLSLAAAGGAVLAAGWHAIPEIALHDGLTAIVWAPLILAGANMRGGPLTLPALTYLGRISFSLYLTHTTVLSVVHSIDRHLLGGALLAFSPWCLTVSSTLAAIALSSLLFAGVEDRARRSLMRRYAAAPTPV